MNLIPENNSYIIYSDGACSGNPGPGGWAYILCNPNLGVEEGAGFQPSTTNNRMEMMAAMEGIRRVPINEPIIVLTDSVYLIRGITQWIFGWQKRDWKNAEGAEILNKDLWQQLWSVVRGRKIDWRYIPGHKGFAGNERVDELAVGQSLRSPIHPYSGSYSQYPYQVLPLPEKIPLPEMKKGGSKSSDKAALYLSYVNRSYALHKTWGECQARVKGVSNAKFKKVTSEAEANEVLRSWGVTPDKKISL